MKLEIRLAQLSDAEAISATIISSLRETNSKDYAKDVIERVERSFSPEAVRELMKQRMMFAALHDGTVLGTGSLDGRAVRTMFIHPHHQRQGIGRQLMARIEEAALQAGVTVLAVPSSVTAEPFYAKLGFRPIRDSYHGEERTIIMERTLKTAP